MIESIRKFGFCFIALTLASCAAGPCRKVADPDLAGQHAAQGGASGAATPSAGTPQGGPAMAGTQGKAQNPATSTVLVYKADGSLQCGMGKKISLQEMEKQDLGGIKVLSRDNRSDGLMRIQVCGSPTGMINVFEVAATDRAEVEKRGFKILETN